MERIQTMIFINRVLGKITGELIGEVNDSYQIRLTEDQSLWNRIRQQHVTYKYGQTIYARKTETTIVTEEHKKMRVDINTIKTEDTKLFINGIEIDAAIESIDVRWDPKDEVWIVDLSMLAAEVIAGY